MDTQERYEIRRKLGQGGVGAVYEGYDTQLKRKVAIKRLLSGDEESHTEETVAELLRECHSLSALSSPNIVSVFDFGEDSDGPFVVMELLEGETLEEVIKRAPFTETDFLSIAEQSLEGILAAHDAHFLHRDLKPCNFMITWLPSGRMQVKLLDFGLAKFSVEPTKQTIAHGNALFGSIYFMAPEQFEQDPLDGRTDLYSLGAVFYYALTGAYPFDGDSVAQVMAGHLTGNYKDLREYRPDVSPALCKWVMSLISRYPDDRPASCAAALEQFNGIVRGTYEPPEPTRGNPQSDEVADTRPGVHTATVKLQVPGAAPSLSGTSIGSGLQSSRVTAKLDSENAEGLPKWVLFTAGGILSLVALLLIFFVNGDDESEPTAAETEKAQEEQKAEESKITELPSGTELKRILRLPDNIVQLLGIRDRNGDGQLSIEEFAVAPVSEREELLRDYFPLIDLDSNGLLSSNELNKAYRKKD